MLARHILFGFVVYFAAPAWTTAEPEVAFRCGSKTGLVCIISTMKFSDPQLTLNLQQTAGKTQLNIKAGSIEALTMKQCESLRTFEKITVGRTGLRELCIATTFRQVTAENNNIRTLHVDNADVEGHDFSIEILKLNNNQLDSVDSMVAFVALKELHLEWNALKTLNMASFARMKKLEKLFLSNNRLSRLATDSVIELPQLSFIGLQNNTLTALNVVSWEMESLNKFELASNNLTQVHGIDSLNGLTEISLASNQWECMALEDILVTLNKNDVTIRDADRDCDGIRNSSICCTVATKPSEATLLTELKKISQLEERFKEAAQRFDKQIETHKKSFENALDEVRKAPPAKIEATTELCNAANNSPPAATQNPDDEDAGSTADNPPPNKSSEVTTIPSPTAAEECICPKQKLDALTTQLTELQHALESTNHTVTTALANQPHLNRMTMLTKHELRTAVKRGEQKVKEVNTRLGMLRDYVKNKLDLLVQKR